MKSALTVTLFATVLFTEQAQAGHKMNKIKHVAKDVGKKVVKVVSDPDVQNVIISFVPGGEQGRIVAKVIQKVVNSQAAGFKSNFKDFIKDQIDEHKEEIIDAAKDAAKEKVKKEVAGKISEHVSDETLQEISDSMYIPLINEKVDSVMGKVSKDKLDSQDFKDYIDSIVQ